MITIHKYPLDLNLGNQIIKIPEEAEILDIQIQDGKPVLWAVVYDSNPLEEIEIVAFPTGVTFMNPCHYYEYISTVQFGGLVIHYFEHKNVKK
ncbi:hypothetical protein HER18_02865 [Chryseobacterium sp. NEB161]|nr:hypothetical protein HER18_02865 [Chryseobacterium sp. NEB161]